MRPGDLYISSVPLFEAGQGIRMFPGFCFFRRGRGSPIFPRLHFFRRDQEWGCLLGSAFLGAVMVVDISSDPFFQGGPGIRMFPGLCFFGVLYISSVPLFQARPRRSGCCLGSAFSGAAGGLVYFLGSAFSGGIRMFPGFCSAGILGDPHVSWVLLFQAWQRIPDISWVPLFQTRPAI